jgi:tetratricopeptide (TPR) repeat protein
MAFLRRRKPAEREESVPEEITITLDGLTSAKLRLGAMVERHGEDHPETIKAMQTVANHLSHDPQHHPDAAELLQYIAELLYRRLGPDHPDLLAALYQAGDMQCGVGNLELAEQMLRHALTGQERVLGRDHPDTLTTAQALGITLTRLDRPAEAQALHEDVSERRTRAFGAAHEDTLISRGNAADALRSAGRFEEAADLYRAVLRDTVSAFGTGSRKAAISRNNLAATVFQLGRPEEAANLFREVLAAVGDEPDQKDFASGVRNNLATVLYGLEEYGEAGELLRHSVAECEAVFGADHPDTIRSVDNLARVLAVEGNRAEATRLARRCLAHYERRLPPSHPKIADLRNFMDELS